jgi:hypothetical protein
LGKIFLLHIQNLQKKGCSPKWNFTLLKNLQKNLFEIYFKGTFEVLKWNGVVVNEISNNWRPQKILLEKYFKGIFKVLKKIGCSFKWNFKQLKNSKKNSLGKIFLGTFKVLKRRNVGLNEILDNWRLQSFTFKAHLKSWKEKGLGFKQDSKELKTAKQF